MSPFFVDVLGAPELNWGTNPITVRTKTKIIQHGYVADETVVDQVFEDVTSPQLLSEEEVRNKGFGQYADGEVYEVFSLTEIPLNNDGSEYRTIIFNNHEYEIIKCSPFGVNYGSDFDGYFDIYFYRRTATQGGF